MISFRQLQYFVTIARFGSMRRAAEDLGVTQPTLSVQVSHMEKDLGVTLFERGRRATVLTPQGRELLPAAQRLLGQQHDFEELAHSLGSNEQSLYRLGVPPTLGPYLLPLVMPEIHARYQRLQLYVREDIPRELEQGLLEGRFDLILSPLPLRHRELACEVLFREPLLLVAPREMGLPASDEFAESDLAGREILGLDERHHLHGEVSRICERTGAILKRDYEGTSLDNLRQMVLMGMGIALLPALYVASEIHHPEQFQILPLSGSAPYREHGLVHRPNSPARPFFLALAELVRDTMARDHPRLVTPIRRR